MSSWQDVTVPKLRRGPRPSLGNAPGAGLAGTKPIPRAEIRRQAELAQHGACIEHVTIEGLAEPVCIRRGEKREAVLAAARELL